VPLSRALGEFSLKPEKEKRQGSPLSVAAADLLRNPDALFRKRSSDWSPASPPVPPADEGIPLLPWKYRFGPEDHHRR